MALLSRLSRLQRITLYLFAGDERLIELLKNNAGQPLDDIIRVVMETVGKWAHDPAARDDITVLLARKL